MFEAHLPVSLDKPGRRKDSLQRTPFGSGQGKFETQRRTNVAAGSADERQTKQELKRCFGEDEWLVRI
jgi:hypothetical protein